jgi:hypothetical protein
VIFGERREPNKAVHQNRLGSEVGHRTALIKPAFSCGSALTKQGIFVTREIRHLRIPLHSRAPQSASLGDATGANISEKAHGS